jgi:hypothetical protein
MLRLPLWFVTERKPIAAQDQIPRDDSRAVLAFSTTDKLSKFLSARVAGEWKLTLVNDREGLVGIVATSHNDGTESIRIDPQVDGAGGERVSLRELMKFSTSLR